uniref:tRNA (adenine(58)-N(1))-methyltransferase non-catalytic subunit TRM6 n=2 Tax=Meloidogyne incognita TaxID=6306 RepID=A0A914LND8_MELIC
MISENSIIRDGDYSILQKVGGEQLRPCRLLSGQRALIEKLSFDPTIAFGKPFGIFEVCSNGKTSVSTDLSQNESFSDIHQIEHCESKPQQGDNISLDSSVNDQKQIMTADDIAKLKAEGLSTENLVSKLVNGNSSFKDRSQFSKEKYVRKMTKKHSGKVMISRPNIRLLCQSYFYKDPERLAHLRLDQLALLIQFLNIHSCGCNVFVYENTLGLLGAAVMERLDNQGNCIFLHRGDWPQSIPCIDAMNNRNQNNFLPLRITSLLQPDLLKDEEEADQQKIQRRQNLTSQEEMQNKSTINCDEEEDTSLQNMLERRVKRREKEKRALDLLSKNSINGDELLNVGELDGILLAGRTIDPVDVLKQVIDGLRLSGSVVIYSPIKQHILKAWNFLRSTNSFIDMQIQEQFCRTHQILPNQTHPLMQQTVTGGYILSAIKILSSEKFKKLTAED